MAKDPYKLLGVPKTASDADIRKAYRALAKKLHPDINPGDAKSAERFKEVSAAYSLLTDKDMKARYDSGQVDGSGQQHNPFSGGNPFAGGGFQRTEFMGGGSGDMNDLFASLFGMNMNNMRSNEGPVQRQRRSKKGADIHYKLTIPFTESISGSSKLLTGGIKVKIPAGVENGQILRLRGKGHKGSNGGLTGDARIEITVNSHKYLSRDGNKLYLRLPISLQEAVLGAKIRVPMPGGTIQLAIPAGSNSETKMRLKGKGIAGDDLYVTLLVMIDDPKDDALREWALSVGVGQNHLRSELKLG